MTQTSTLALAALLTIAPFGQEQDTAGKALAPEDRAWIEHAVDGWERVCRDILRVAPAPLPWMIFFDEAHVWHANAGPGFDALQPTDGAWRVSLAPASGALPLVGWAHGDGIRLPTGDTVPPAIVAFTSSVEADGTAFLVLSLPAIWRRDHSAKGARLDALTLAVFAHEMSHTRQAEAYGGRITAIAEEHGLGDDFDDDVVQDRFGTRPGFAAAYAEEVELFFRAAAEDDRELCRQLAEEAVRLMGERRAAHLAGEAAFYAELEDLFLLMEGAANWAGYRVLLNEGLPPEDAQDVMRGSRTSWTQEEGLAIFLTVDRLLPDWRACVFGAQVVELQELLAEATAR